MINNEVIVIGCNHHNTLGVIRMLGEKQIKSNVIITFENKYAYVTKSRYVKNYDIVKENEKDIKEILKEKYIDKKNKAILIPTSDFAALFIDKNLNELKKNFIVPSIDDKQGKIEKLMNKYTQYELAKKYNIKMAKTIKIDLTKKININKISYPCILKPITSALGNKLDIKVCNNKDNFDKAIKELKSKKYKEILIQEKIDYKYEYGILGCCHNDKIVISGIIKKIRIYPAKRGSTCYGYLEKPSEFNYDISNIKKMMKELKYKGLFDIEVFVKENKLYLNEINFRNSGSSYSLTYGNVNLIYIWINMMLNNNINNINDKINKEYYFQSEFFDYRLFKEKQITLKNFIKSFKKSKVHLFFNKKDNKILFYKFIYAIMRRIKN